MMNISTINMKGIFATLAVFLTTICASAQIPANTQLQVLKAEDSRTYDKPLEALMAHPIADVRLRAALAAGRIGDDRAVPALARLLTDKSQKVREMAAFALGEIESPAAADILLIYIGETAKANMPGVADHNNRGRLAEAAGKIAAANAKEPKAKNLARAVVFTLEAEALAGTQQNAATVLLALTAILRARPEGGDVVTAKFLTNPDPRVRADAANTLSRLRAKNANATLRAMLTNDADPVARANAARALGAAEDKDAVSILVAAATTDRDSRVRVSAIRSLGSLKDATVADGLLDHGEKLLQNYSRSKLSHPSEASELIEISTALGRLLPDTRNERAVNFLRNLANRDNGYNAEIALARFRIAPGRGDDEKKELTNWHQYVTLAQIIGEFATVKTTNEQAIKMKGEAPDQLRPLVEAFLTDTSAHAKEMSLAAPDVLRAYAQFKPADLSKILRMGLAHDNLFVRAVAAELIAEQPASKENIDALKKAFDHSLEKDTEYDDAQLAILDALSKLDGKNIEDTLQTALASPDALVRKKAVEIIRTANADKDRAYRGITDALIRTKLQVSPFRGKTTKMGQVLYTDADYRRAIARRNGMVKAVLTTEKGAFTIDLLPEDAPLTVDNFIKLARSNYFNGLEVHRVVPNFVMQDGDPRGDGNGGPGWSIRCEINMLPFDRGAVGMALSGKDTGGSQWFVMHSPQPHLDGGYTVFGRVNESDMKVVDTIVRGDKITSVKIVESNSPRRTRSAQSKK
jgi:cyclophilin family peptidyl-prolyl cis-trans isomerase/HEAT repeat protein